VARWFWQVGGGEAVVVVEEVLVLVLWASLARAMVVVAQEVGARARRKLRM